MKVADVTRETVTKCALTSLNDSYRIVEGRQSHGVANELCLNMCTNTQPKYKYTITGIQIRRLVHIEESRQVDRTRGQKKSCGGRAPWFFCGEMKCRGNHLACSKSC